MELPRSAKNLLTNQDYDMVITSYSLLQKDIEFYKTILLAMPF